MTKNYWFWVAAVVVVGGFFLYAKLDLGETGVGKAEFILNSNGKARVFEGMVNPDMTALLAVYTASQAGHFDFKYFLTKDDAVQLLSLDKLPSSPAKGWHFYLNKRLIDVGRLNQVKIRAGDLIEAKYE